MDFNIDPRIFISKPYIKCPKCEENNTYGVLSIHGHSYTRRCNMCWHTESYALPKLSKKIIYLDQFMISNMMKNVTPNNTNSDPNGEFYKTAFDKLSYLTKLQVIICPDSYMHYQESVVSSNYEYLKNMYKTLSNGIRFEHMDTIARFHLVSGFKKWLNMEDVIILSRDNVCNGYNDWQDRLRIDINMNMEIRDREYLAKSKNSLDSVLTGLFKYWQSINLFNFDEIYKKEMFSLSDLYINKYLDFFNKSLRMMAGDNNINIDEIIGNEQITIVTEMMDAINEDELDVVKKLMKIKEYLLCKDIAAIPHHRIACLMWAGIARKAAAGQKKMQNVSIVNDIKVISTYLPYCDSMFIDNECAKLLSDEPVNSRIGFDTKVFSLSSKNNFLSYLDDIKEEVTQEHLDLVVELYGDTWLKGEYYIPEEITTKANQ
ncbi:MAG TPA: hypothetical protein DCP90_02855 [Clostridiales bacterium]|nr:MAG: hypothetical protein A2Y22_00100 [Clostridiales bacterium GWD2_32_59]HAN09533.1 hypothetical protein [Clostridiales bacterium]